MPQVHTCGTKEILLSQVSDSISLPGIQECISIDDIRRYNVIKCVEKSQNVDVRQLMKFICIRMY